MGWVGVAVLGTLILIILAFKLFVIPYMKNSTKALHIEGYSEFHLVYTGNKKIKTLQLPAI
jgi:hypothetical protein